MAVLNQCTFAFLCRLIWLKTWIIKILSKTREGVRRIKVRRLGVAYRNQRPGLLLMLWSYLINSQATYSGRCPLARHPILPHIILWQKSISERSGNFNMFFFFHRYEYLLDFVIIILQYDLLMLWNKPTKFQKAARSR